MKKFGHGLRSIGALLLVLSLSLSALYSDGNPYQELLQITNDFVVVSENFKKSLDGFETRLNSLENSNTIQTESYNVLGEELARARNDIELARDSLDNGRATNDDLDAAIGRLRGFAERYRTELESL